MKYKVSTGSDAGKMKAFGTYTVSLASDGSALLMDATGTSVIERLRDAKVQWMQAKGFMIGGFFQKTGNSYAFRCWFCGYVEGGE